MTNISTYNALEDVFESINRAVDEQPSPPDAVDILGDIVDPGGGIRTLGDTFEPTHESPTTITERAIEFDYTYGIDGSTTKDLRFNNGLIVTAAVAGVGVAGKDTKSQLSQKSTLSVIPYFPNSQLDIGVPQNQENIKIHVRQFPQIQENISDLSSWINELARTYAEGKHLRWLSDDIDMPVFVDGPLFPPKVFLWILYDQYGSSSGTPMDVWPSMVLNVMQSYISSIEQLNTHDNPVFGVQKSTTATRVIEALQAKHPDKYTDGTPYNSDGQLFNSALSQADGSEHAMSYTPWYVEEQVNIGSGQNPTLIEPFAGYDDISLKYGDPDQYKRAYFFVKPPNNNPVFRVGTPVLCFDKPYSPAELRDIALNEIAKQKKEPQAVLLADDKARIPRGLRTRLRGLINKDAHVSRQEQRSEQNQQ